MANSPRTGLELDKLGQGAKHHGQHQPRQQQLEQVGLPGPEQPAVDDGRVSQHQQQRQHAVLLAPEQQQALAAEQQHQQGLQQQIDRLVPHDGGGQDAVARQGLEADGRDRDADAGDCDGGQAQQPLGDDVAGVEIRPEQHKGRGEQGQQPPDPVTHKSLSHRRCQRISSRNSTPPRLPAVSPMGTSKGWISSRLSRSHASSSRAP